MEVAEGARIILTQNLHVSSGLMNGTQGTVVAIVYEQGSDPNHPDPAYRMPALLVLDVPKYQGEPFFHEPERRTWIPLYPRTVRDAQNKDISRTQFPLVLGLHSHHGKRRA